MPKLTQQVEAGRSPSLSAYYVGSSVSSWEREKWSKKPAQVSLEEERREPGWQRGWGWESFLKIMNCKGNLFSAPMLTLGYVVGNPVAHRPSFPFGWICMYHSPLPKGKHPSLSTIAFHAPVFLSTWQHLRGFLLQCCCTWRLLGITEKAIQPVQRPWVQNLVGFSSCVSLSKWLKFSEPLIIIVFGS